MRLFTAAGFYVAACGQRGNLVSKKVVATYTIAFISFYGGLLAESCSLAPLAHRFCLSLLPILRTLTPVTNCAMLS